jgi:mono/diheme cytochrome c family protein
MKYKNLLIILLVPLFFASCNKNKNNPGYAYMGKYDMYYSKFYKAYSPNPILPNGMTNQIPPEGSVARGKMPFPYPGGNIAEKAVNQTKAGLELINPIAVSEDVLAEGKETFRIFCSDCHGIQGKGDGHLYTAKLFPAKPTSLVESYVQNKPDGEIYYVITYGSISGLMGAHGYMIPSEDRWKLVHYLRELAK